MEVIAGNIETLTQLLLAAYKSSANRYLLGITGIPGAGKSTMADRLMRSVNKALNQELAVVVPMDGFHYHNTVLKEQNLLHCKGAPETFDAEGFVSLVKEIRSDDNDVYCPAYNRKLHNPVNNAILVKRQHRIIIVEGNYLLLNVPPWQELAALFDETWFIDAAPAIVRKRLLNRHKKSGRSIEEALRKISATDMPNAALIFKTVAHADKIIKL